MQPRPKLRRIALGVALGCLTLYGAATLALWAKQDALLFHGMPAYPVPKGPRIEPLELPVDGAILRGVVRRATGEGKHPAILYFGGNADEATQHAASTWPDGAVVVCVNYRGFGASTGAPSEKALLADAEKLFDTITARDDVDPKRVLAWGGSLGTGVATHLASVRPVAAVVLLLPYDSIAEVASRHFSWFPVRTILRHPFDSVSKAPKVTAPLFAVAGGKDQLIPPEHAERLVAAWGGPKDFVIIPEGTHNELPGPEVGRVTSRAFRALGLERE